MTPNEESHAALVQVLHDLVDHLFPRQQYQVKWNDRLAVVVCCPKCASPYILPVYHPPTLVSVS